MIKLIFLEEFGKAFIPKRVRPTLRFTLQKAGIQEVPYRLFGTLFYISLLVTYFLYFNNIYPYLIQSQIFYPTLNFFVSTFVSWSVIQLFLIVFAGLCIYFWLDMKTFKRVKEMENKLPGFLRYLSENLKGGMPFDRALYTSIRARFGVLADEIKLVAKKVISGYDVDIALEELSRKYESPTLRRSLNLIVEGMRGGAHIADLITRIEENLQETQELQSDMAATNTTYVIFLSAIVLIIAPALFGLSFNLLLILKGVMEKMGKTGGGKASGLSMSLGSLDIKPEGFKTFSLLALGVIATFASMIISIIKSGNMKSGIKTIPVYVAISIAVYMGFRNILQLIFGDLFT